MGLDLQKPSQFAQELKSILMIHSCKLQKHQVHGYRYSGLLSQTDFANPLKPRWCITRPVEPLMSTNQIWWGAKLLPMSVLTYHVECVHLCHLLRLSLKPAVNTARQS